MGLRENFIINNVSGNINLHNLNFLSENVKDGLTDKLVRGLYTTALKRYDQTESFGDIPKSKGDVTKLNSYQTIVDTMEACRNIQEKLNQPMQELDVLEETWRILSVSYKKYFCLAFANGDTFGQFVYNTTVLNVIAMGALCTKSLMNYISHKDLTLSQSTKSVTKGGDALLLQALQDFNKAVSDGHLKTIMDSTLGRNQLLGTSLSAGGAILLALAGFIPVMRTLIYFIYNTRMHASEYLKTQEEFLKINISELESGMTNKSSREVKTIVAKQKKSIERIEKMINKLEVRMNDAAKTTKQELGRKVEVSNVDDVLGTDLSSFSLM